MFRVISDNDPNNGSASGSSFTLDIALGCVGGFPLVPYSDLWGVSAPLISQLGALLWSF